MFNLVPFSRNFLARGCLALQSRVVCLLSPGMLSPRNLHLWGLFWLVHASSYCIKSASKWSEQGWEHGREAELPSLLAVGYLSVVDQLDHSLPRVVSFLLLLLRGGEQALHCPSLLLPKPWTKTCRRAGSCVPSSQPPLKRGADGLWQGSSFLSRG